MSAGGRSAWALYACAALLVGPGLRVFELREQIVCDDELHSVRAALSLPYAALFGSIDHAYNSIPHALILKALADSVGLDELTLRLPSLVPGVALLLAGPWLVWRRFGAPAAALFAALMAISPALVLYSRIARSYAFATLLVFLAVLALERWLATQRPRLALAYVCCAVAAIWFHQLAAPAVLVPPALAAWLAARDATQGRRMRDLAAPLVLGGAVALLAAALQWNALFLGWFNLVGKAGKAQIGEATLLGAASLLAGDGVPWLVGAFWIGSALGCGLALRRRSRLAALMLVSVAAQVAAVWTLAPWLAEIPRVFTRYVVFALPFVLLFLALLLAELSRFRVANRDWPLPLLAGACLVALLHLLGPLPASYYRPNNFTTHAEFQDERSARGAALPASEFYRRLRSEPGDFAIVETPWHNSPGLMPYHAYQRLHGKRVRIGLLGALLDPPNPDEFSLGDPRAAFRTFVDVADPTALRAADVRYVLVHRKLAAELGYPALTLELDPVVSELARRLGPPVWEDAALAVFDVSRGRTRGEAARATPR